MDSVNQIQFFGLKSVLENNLFTQLLKRKRKEIVLWFDFTCLKSSLCCCLITRVSDKRFYLNKAMWVNHLIIFYSSLWRLNKDKKIFVWKIELVLCVAEFLTNFSNFFNFFYTIVIYMVIFYKQGDNVTKRQMQGVTKP